MNASADTQTLGALSDRFWHTGPPKGDQLNTKDRDRFAHVSHTYTHMELNNATYADASKEITFNQAWLQAAQNKFASSTVMAPEAAEGGLMASKPAVEKSEEKVSSVST